MRTIERHLAVEAKNRKEMQQALQDREDTSAELSSQLENIIVQLKDLEVAYGEVTSQVAQLTQQAESSAIEAIKSIELGELSINKTSKEKLEGIEE